MPSYKDPDENREYMRQYMRVLRRRQMMRRSTAIGERRTAFIARERNLRWRREWRNIVEGRG